MAAWDDVRERLSVTLAPPRFPRRAEGAVVRARVLPHVDLVALVEDVGGARVVGAHEPTRWNKPFDEVLSAGLARLAEARPDVSSEGGSLRVSAPDGRGAARLLLPGWLAGLSEMAGGPPCCAAPDEATLLVARADDEGAVARLVELAAATWAASDRALSPLLYAPAGGGETVAPFELPREHPAWRAARRAERALEAATYEAQRAALGGLDDAPLFAPCMVVDLPDAGPVTATVLAVGLEALLPLADVVMVRGHGAGDALVLRADLERLGLMAGVPDFDPPRAAMLRMPTPEEIAKVALS